MELSKFFKKDPKKAAKDLPGKRIQPNTNGPTNYCRGDYKSGGCQMQSFSKRLAASVK
jgi:hypothetical protein